MPKNSNFEGDQEGFMSIARSTKIGTYDARINV